jgi:hypothetical protein
MRVLLGVVALGVALAGVWLLDERNRIAVQGPVSFQEHEAVLGVTRGMTTEAATRQFESRGLERNGIDEWVVEGAGGIAPQYCGEIAIGSYDHLTFDDLSRWPRGSACLLSENGRVVVMSADYVMLSPL